MGGFGGMPPMSPQQQQQLLSALQSLGQRGQGGPGQQGPQAQPQQPPQGGMPGQGGGPPQMPQGGPQSGGSPQMPQLGGNNSMLPTGRAVPNIGGVPMTAQATAPSVSKHFSGLPFAVQGIKQEMHQGKVQKYAALASEWVAMQQNPDAQKAVDQAAQKDPKMAKALESKKKEFVKMVDEAQKDPNSAAAQGIQKAYKQLTQQDEQKMKYQQFQQQMQEMSMRMQQMQAQTRAQNALADQRAQYGEVTDRDKYMEQQKNQRIADTIKGRLGQVQTQMQGAQKRLEEHIASSEKLGKMFEEGRNKRAANSEAGKNSRQNKTIAAREKSQKSALDSITKEMNAVRGEMQAKAKDLKDTQEQLGKVTTWAVGDSDEVQMRAAGLQQDINQLSMRATALDSQWQMMIQGGALPKEQAPAPSASGGGPVIHDFSK